MNTDCWLLVLGKLSQNERVSCRLVSQQWCQLIDYLSFNQKCLHFYSSEPNYFSLTEPSLHVGSIPSGHHFRWPHCNINYNEFVKIFSQYPKLKELLFCGFTHWNDHHLIRLTECCRSIESLSFYSCPHLGENYFNDFGFQNLTVIGWQNIAQKYGTTLRTLVLEDCDLENYHLGLIVESFRSLVHLNLANNSDITNFAPLASLSSTVETLKVGPKLNVDCKKNQALYNHEIPVEFLVTGSGSANIRTLQLQGILTQKLSRLHHLPKLEHLIVKYASFSAVEDIFSLEVEILTSTAAKMKQLRTLELYQVNQSSSIDLHWLRQRLSSVSVSSNLKSNLPLLNSFSLHSTSPLVVVDQFRLVDFVLASTPNLTTFSLSCATGFDSDSLQHYNLNQTILVLLQKYGGKLVNLKLENLFPTGLFSYLAYVVLSSPQLTNFIMDDREVLPFLYCLDMQIDQLMTNDKLSHRKPCPLKLTFTTGGSRPRIVRHQEQLKKAQPFNYLPDYVQIKFSADQPDHRLRSVDSSPSDSFTLDQQHHLYSSSSSSLEHDLSDLCQLLDTSCALVGRGLDLLSVLSNNVVLSSVACLFLLRPSHLVRLSARWLGRRLSLTA